MNDISKDIISINYKSSLDETNKCITCDFNTIYISDIIIEYKGNNKLIIESEVTTDKNNIITEADLMRWLTNKISLDDLIKQLTHLSKKRLSAKFESHIIVEYNDKVLLNLTVQQGEREFSKYSKLSKRELNDIIKNDEQLTQEKFNSIIAKLIEKKVNYDDLIRTALTLSNKVDNVTTPLESFFISKNDAYYFLELYLVFGINRDRMNFMNKILNFNNDFIEKIISLPSAKEIFYNSHLTILKDHIKINR